MTQSLWYLRFEGRTVGPFPAPQIRELLHAKEITADWEISLDQVDWLNLRESTQFQAEQAEWLRESNPDRLSRQHEREEARQRWLGDDADLNQAVTHNKLEDDQLRRAVEADHERTQILVKTQSSRAPQLWGGLLVFVLLIGVGYAIWFGQRGEKPIQAGINLAVSCDAPLRERVNWSGCDKRGLDLNQAVARSGQFNRARFDNSQMAQADLSYAMLQGASLRNVDLQSAKLTGADLSGADLSGANLSEASLDFAVLKGANLEGARLQGARLGRTEWIDGRLCAETSVGDCQ